MSGTPSPPPLDHADEEPMDDAAVPVFTAAAPVFQDEVSALIGASTASTGTNTEDESPPSRRADERADASSSPPRGDNDQEDGANEKGTDPRSEAVDRCEDPEEDEEAEGLSAGVLDKMPPLLSRGSSFPRVMDIAELVRLGSTSRPGPEEEEGVEGEAAPVEPLSLSPCPAEEEEGHRDHTEPVAETTQEPSADGTNCEEAPVDTPMSDAPAVAVAAAEEPKDEEEEKQSHNVNDQPTAVPLLPSPPPAHPDHAPHPAVAVAQPTPPSLPPPRVRPLSAGAPDLDRHLLRLRRTLLSALPVPLRRLYSLNILDLSTAALSVSTNSSNSGHRHEGENDEEEDDDDDTVDRPASASGGEEAVKSPAVPRACAPADVLQGSTELEVFAAAAMAEARLRGCSADNNSSVCAPISIASSSSHQHHQQQHHHSPPPLVLAVSRSSIPDVPKALPLLLDRLSEDKYHVNAAWGRHRDETAFVRNGSTVAVRKRRRAGVLAATAAAAAMAAAERGHQAGTPQAPGLAAASVATAPAAAAISGGRPVKSRRLDARSGPAIITVSAAAAAAAGVDGPIPTPRRSFAVKDWRPEAEETVKALHRRMTAEAAAVAAQDREQQQQQQQVTMSVGAPNGAVVGAVDPSSDAVSLANGGGGGPTRGRRGAAAAAAAAAQHGPTVTAAPTTTTTTAHRRVETPPLTATAATAAAAAAGKPDGCAVSVTDVLSEAELALYARYAMSSGKLRHEVGEPFAVLTRRVAELRKGQLAKRAAAMLPLPP